MRVRKVRSPAASATPSRRQKPLNSRASLSPSHPSPSRGASPALSIAGLGERVHSRSPSMQKVFRSGVVDDASTVLSGSVGMTPGAGHLNTTVASLAMTNTSSPNVAQEGKRFESNTYETVFNLQGSYDHVVVVRTTATLWCANTLSGSIDLYSCVTGQFVASLLPLKEEMEARRAELAELPLNTQSAASTTSGGVGGGPKGTTNGLRRPLWGSTAVTPRSRGLVPTGGRRSLPALNPPPISTEVPEREVRVSSMCATSTHVWIGYTDGSVAVYDSLLLKLNTAGQLHHDSVVSIVSLSSGQTVTASADGLLILWDTEQGGFEAVTRVTVLLDAVREGAGALCAMAATHPGTRVCCGFESGAAYSVIVANRPQEQPEPQALCGHNARVNDMATVRDLLFTAAEDNTVCVWYCGVTSGGRGRRRTLSSNALVEAAHDADRAPQLPPTSGAMKLLKRISVRPCVRSFLAEEQTHSLWVAYVDGLMERWSADPDDDFGVEEAIDSPLDASVAGGVRSVLSLSVAHTMQWLALSSNGVNKIWYGHKNTLEIDLAHSTSTLAQVVEQDIEDAAVWRERVNLLKQDEMERKEKYLLILEQLSEQHVLVRYYDTWKRAVLFCGARRRRSETMAEVLRKKSSVQLLRRFFGKWAFFYDAQQRHMRSYVLSVALSRATEVKQIQHHFLRWQSYTVRHNMVRSTQRCAEVMARMVSTAMIASFFHRWRSAATATATAQRKQRSVSVEQVSLLANKAQRQVMQRILRQWIAHGSTRIEDQRWRSTDPVGQAYGTDSMIPGTSALARFAAHYAQLQAQRRGRQLFFLWQRWTKRRARLASLAAVAALREEQLLHEYRQSVFLRWRQRVHARHMDENTQHLKDLELELRRTEAEHGDIFEKLQLQRQLDLLLQRQAAEEAHLMHIKYQLESAEQTCTELRASQRQRGIAGNNNALCADMADSSNSTVLDRVASGASAAVEQTNAAQFVATDMEFSMSATSENPPPIQQQEHQVVLSATSRGHMASNASWYRSMVDQQRLSPVVLAHMPIDDAVHHVMSQLKGNVINLYTDLALFRQVKDRRRADASAAGILLEAFGEVKRLIVTTVRGTAANAASPVPARMGGKAKRWPLSMEALDSIPVHHCATVLSAIKTLVVAYDLLRPEETSGVQMTCEEVVANADWIFLIAHACYLRRKPLLPVNNRQTS